MITGEEFRIQNTESRIEELLRVNYQLSGYIEGIIIRDLTLRVGTSKIEEVHLFNSLGYNPLGIRKMTWPVPSR